jgi:hypothetical protein
MSELKKQLNALLYVPEEGVEVDDTRFDKLYDILKEHCKDKEQLLKLYDEGFVAVIKVHNANLLVTNLVEGRITAF